MWPKFASLAGRRLPLEPLARSRQMARGGHAEYRVLLLQCSQVPSVPLIPGLALKQSPDTWGKSPGALYHRHRQEKAIVIVGVHATANGLVLPSNDTLQKPT